MTVIAPRDYVEFKEMLRYAVCRHDGPIAIRYPRGQGTESLTGNTEIVEKGKGELLCRGKDITLVAIGSMVETALKVSEKLKEFQFSCDVINGRFIKPLDEKLITQSAMKTGQVVILEENSLRGGFGSSVLELLNRAGIAATTRMFGFPDEFIPHGSKTLLLNKYHLDCESIFSEVLKMLKQKK